MTPVVVLVLKSGGDFTSEHVIQLWLGLIGLGGWRGHVVCLTDTPGGSTPADVEQLPLTRAWQGWWSKLELCAPQHDRLGDVLYLDLDTVVVGAVAEIAAVGRLTMLSDFLRPARLASGVMYLTVKARRRAWNLLHAGDGPEQTMQSFRRRGDQGFFEWAWFQEASRWQDAVPGQIVSYKKDVRPQGGWAEGTRLICYHGKPRPWETQ